jgi:ATP-dependent Lon protease
MRKETLTPPVSKHLELSENFKIRDEKSVKRLLSGLIKLLFPDGAFNTQELRTVTEIAVEYRQRVRDWLHKIAPGEFPMEKLSVAVKP